MKTNTEVCTNNDKSFDLTNPSADLISDLRIADVAAALSKINRYSGNSRWPFSVAQHSILCSHLVSDRTCVREALMHDAHEMFVGDMTRPCKNALRHRSSDNRTEFDILENLWEVAFRSHFNLPLRCSDAVKDADRLSSEFEMGVLGIGLMPSFQLITDNRKEMRAISDLLCEWDYRKAETMFLARYEEVKHR